MQKAGAHRLAAELGIAIVAPDTSPRGEDVANDEGYDLGQGLPSLTVTAMPCSRHSGLRQSGHWPDLSANERY